MFDYEEILDNLANIEKMKGKKRRRFLRELFKDDDFSFNNLYWLLSIIFILYLVAIPLIKIIIPWNGLIIIIILKIVTKENWFN